MDDFTLTCVHGFNSTKNKAVVFHSRSCFGLYFFLSSSLLHVPLADPVIILSSLDDKKEHLAELLVLNERRGEGEMES